MNVQAWVEPLKEIAIRSGVAILDIYAREEDFGIEAKADHSPLTRADKAANQVICDGLAELAPDIPIISEENKQIPYPERKGFEQFWLVDPLDGTKEFIKRNGEFTVNIALVEGHSPVLSVVYAPVLEEMYWAVKGSGAWRSKNGGTEKLVSPAFTMDDSGLKVVCSRSHLNEPTQQFIDRLDQPEKVSKGSSLKFLMIASGDAHVYPRLGPTMEWDTGAAQLILEESGGKIEVEGNGNPLQYNKEDLLNPYFIAYGRVSG